MECSCWKGSHSVSLHQSHLPGSVLWCRLSPVVRAHKVRCCHTALGPACTVGTQAVGPGVPQVLCAQNHQHRSTEVRYQDRSSRVPGPAVGAAQTLALLLCVPTEPTAAKAGPVPAAGAPFPLGRPARAAELTESAAVAWITQPRGGGSVFSLTSACGQPPGTGAPRAHKGGTQQEASMAGPTLSSRTP